MGRPAKYDWDDKKDICYRLYVEEKLSGKQIVQHFAKHFNIPESELPAPNQFHAHFKIWGFPKRRVKLSDEEEARLVARTKELFNQNVLATQIQKTLNEEGWDLDDYHFRVFRKKHGMLLRNENGFKPVKKRKRSSATDAGEEDEGSLADEDVANDVVEEQVPAASELPPEEAARRAQRLAELQVQSDHLLQTKKRRRRIRGYGHLGPDAPGLQPRYGSETSLDECKAYLHLSNDLYVQLRSQYEAICREAGIIKMSSCADGQWQASKDRLIRENMHLSSMLHPLQPDLDKRANALNCICSDVTKRMRNEGKQISIADANNLLGLDPLKSKDLRRLFYEILEADQFTTVVACGKEHLTQLEQQWYAKSDILQRAMAEADPKKLRAIYLLSKDARKRYCDDQVRKDPSRRQWQKQSHYGPGPGPAQGIAQKAQGTAQNKTTAPTSTGDPQPASPRSRKKALYKFGPAWDGHEIPEFRMSNIAHMAGGPINFDLDPLLSENTHGPPWPPRPHQREPVSQSDSAVQSGPATYPDPPLHPGPMGGGVPAYFRLAHHSVAVGNHPRMWLGKLSTPNVNALHMAATSRSQGAKLTKVWGVVKSQDGNEDRWLVETDDELGVYLQEAGEKATFLVVLEGADIPPQLGAMTF